MKWKKVTKQRYEQMLWLLPPAAHTRSGYLVGEPWTHGRCSIAHEVVPMYQCFLETDKGYFEAEGPVSIKEFEAQKFFPAEARKFFTRAAE